MCISNLITSGRGVGHFQEPGLPRAEIVVSQADIEIPQVIAELRQGSGGGNGRLVDLQDDMESWGTLGGDP